MSTGTIVSRSAFSAAGAKIRTSCTSAQQDCHALWQEKFCPRMPELLTQEGSETYGITWIVDSPSNTETNFSMDYFAALPWPAGKPAPQGLEVTNVPKGLYLEFQLASLEELTQVFRHISSEWLVKHPEYRANINAPSCEVYAKDYMWTKKLTFYFPVVKA